MKSRFLGAARVVTAAVPAVFAVLGAASLSAAHDADLVRTVGAGFTGGFRSLDLLVAAPLLLLPIGTRALRAALPNAILVGACGLLAFELAFAVASLVPAILVRLGLRTVRSVSDKLLGAVAAVSVLSALLGPAWQAEASVAGGAIPGACLVLGAAVLARAGSSEDGRGLPLLGLVFGLAASYEPLVFLAALAGGVPWLAARGRPRIDRAIATRIATAFALGLAPLALGLAVRARAGELALPMPLLGLGGDVAAPVSLRTFLTGEIGLVLGAVAVGSGVLALLVPEGRALVGSLAGLFGAATVAVALRGDAGPERWSAAVLGGFLALHLLGTVVLAAAVVVIARAPVPFAEASAALIVVLELVLPIRSLDETSTQREGRSPRAASVWNDVAWGSVPPASVLLVADKPTFRRIASARAVGAMRGDLVVVPSFDVQGRAGERALVAEPKLAAIYRDIALGLPPEELSLAQLGAQRPVMATFDPKWDRALARHLLPIGLTSRFEPEPRGASDRKKALDAFLPGRERLVHATVARKDPELARATATLLRARAIAMAATGERDILARALDDLRLFSPKDPVEAVLVRRTLTTKGPIDVRDLGSLPAP